MMIEATMTVVVMAAGARRLQGHTTIAAAAGPGAVRAPRTELPQRQRSE